MIYEERFTHVSITKVREYVELCRDKTIPALKTAGGRTICLLSGLIGDRGNTFLQVTGFEDSSAWNLAQKTMSVERNDLIEQEEVRLLKPIASRPKPVIPPEDRRPVYGYRRFFINPEDLAQFVRYSEEGVWPLYEAMDCRILGLFSPIATTYPTEIVLMSGYYGPGHWETTRINRSKPEGMEESFWEHGRNETIKRSGLLVRGSWVRLWHSHDF